MQYQRWRVLCFPRKRLQTRLVKGPSSGPRCRFASIVSTLKQTDGVERFRHWLGNCFTGLTTCTYGPRLHQFPSACLMSHLRRVCFLDRSARSKGQVKWCSLERLDAEVTERISIMMPANEHYHTRLRWQAADREAGWGMVAESAEVRPTT